MRTYGESKKGFDRDWMCVHERCRWHDLPEERQSCPCVRVQVELGLIWVWPESGSEALLESAAKQPALCQLVKDVNPGAREVTTVESII